MEKPDHQLDIVNYLYGEMDAEEKDRFEKRLESDHNLRKEVEALQKTRNVLHTTPTPEQKAWQKSENVFFSLPKKRSSQRIPTILAVAASIVIVLMAGYYTNFSVRYGGGEWVVGFQTTSSVAYADSGTMNEMIRREVAAQQVSFENRLQETRDSLRHFYTFLAMQKLRPLENQPQGAEQGVSEEEFRREMVNWQNGNRKLLQQYFTALNTQQQQYLQEALVQFSDYLQQQREQDLLMIQQNLVDLKDYQDQQKRETNQVLSGLLKTVSKPE